jgi:DNA polymerase III gamma/tau subunit
MSLENVDRVKKQSSEISTELLNRGITELTKTISESRWSSHPRVMLEMCIVRLGAGQEVEKTTVFKNDGLVQTIPEVKRIQPEINQNIANETTHTAPKEPSSDMAGLWKEIVRKAVGEKPMLIRIETRAKLIGMDENNFYVGVEDDVTAKIIKENGRDVLEEKMEQYYGKHLTLRLAKQKGVPLAKEQDDAEAIANQIKERFNVDVEIKP